jgi:hypothetical protein
MLPGGDARLCRHQGETSTFIIPPLVNSWKPFEGDRLRHWLRWLFILNDIANRSLIFAFGFDIEALTLAAAFLSWVVGLPVAAVRMALTFRSMAE